MTNGNSKARWSNVRSGAFLSLGLAVVAVAAAAAWWLAAGSDGPAYPGAVDKLADTKVALAPPSSAPAPAAPGYAPTAASSHGPAELVAEPDGYRMDDYRQPVPPTLKGARVITTEEAEKIHAEQSAVFIDVFPKAPKPPNLPPGTLWRDPSHMSIKGGNWLPNVGYGALAPEVEAYFKSYLQKLSGRDKSKPLVFYCLKDCWMSWNAAKRAMSWGHTNVIWFPDGTDGWTEAGNDIVYLTSEP